MQKIHHGQSGFTLIETLLATAILTIAIVGALSLITQSTTLTGSVRNEHIAANLAQEGVELVQNIRTTNWVIDQPWNTGLIDVTIGGTTDTFITDPSASPVVLTSATCGSITTNLFQKSTYGIPMYVHDDAGSATIFSRCITLTVMDNPDDPGNPQANYIRVQSTVNWGTSQLTAEDHLYNWK
ncbi:MAG: prepilin-type N-terminal cleavage/methylation domain-containing protein [Candidatus Spechtbacteria bacterium]|nr:prepilin-type N-terminal cleavage/methylation domain-containing protein [Candidatus Spechtbacteria bacterium]